MGCIGLYMAMSLAILPVSEKVRMSLAFYSNAVSAAQQATISYEVVGLALAVIS